MSSSPGIASATRMLQLFVQWRSAMVAEQQPYYFPGKFTREFRDRYAISTVYRWRIIANAGETKEGIYIGEAEDLVTRIQRILTPPRRTAKGANTNRRLHDIFRQQIDQGRKIVLDIADIEPFEISGVRFGSDSMGDRFKRRAMENMLLAFAQSSGKYDLLNIFIDPVEKARQALSKLSPGELREVIKRYDLNSRL